MDHVGYCNVSAQQLQGHVAGRSSRRGSASLHFYILCVLAQISDAKGTHCWFTVDAVIKPLFLELTLPAKATNGLPAKLMPLPLNSALCQL